MHGYRRFCNKIYQATKYVLGKLSPSFTPIALDSVHKRTGHESLSDRWILHKLSIAARDMHAALSAREFSTATSITYQYWYSHLCDTYIENSKAIIASGTEEEQKSAKDTLYTALEGGLTMIHPFMPFLTEELWQRLPRRPGDTTPSIVKAAYPIYIPQNDDPASEEAYELLLAVSKAIRSLTAEYAIKDSATLFIQLFSPQSHHTCSTQLQSIRSLSGKATASPSASISILAATDPKPTGCVVAAVNAQATVFLHVKGKIDIDVEIEKAKAKLHRASESVRRQRGVVHDEAWQKKAGEGVQEMERRRLRDMEAEVRELEGSLGEFERLKLE